MAFRKPPTPGIGRWIISNDWSPSCHYSTEKRFKVVEFHTGGSVPLIELSSLFIPADVRNSMGFQVWITFGSIENLAHETIFALGQ